MFLVKNVAWKANVFSTFYCVSSEMFAQERSSYGNCSEEIAEMKF